MYGSGFGMSQYTCYEVHSCTLGFGGGLQFSENLSRWGQWGEEFEKVNICDVIRERPLTKLFFML